MVLVTLLNISLLGNIVTSLNLGNNLAPKPTVDIVQTSEFSYRSRYLSQGKDDLGSSLNFENIPNLELKKPTKTAKPIQKSVSTSKTVNTGGYLNIKKIGLNNVKLAKATIKNIQDTNLKLLYQPILESSISPDLCSDSGNSYISGHSEPTSNGDKNYPGVNIFSMLNLLEPGDIISVKNSRGVSCEYKVTGWDKAVTDENNGVSRQVFADAYYPITDKPTLTIQTCQKGSATVRLLLRAEKI